MIPFQRLRHYRHQQGFTLIEIVIAATMVAILAVIAMSSYRSHALRANRTVAKSAISSIMTREESWYLDHKVYTSNIVSDLKMLSSGTQTTIYLARDGSVTGTQSTASDGTASIYSLSVNALGTVCPGTGTTATYTGYTVTATPVNGQLRDDTACASICLTSTNVRMISGTGTVASCWSK